jgi:hypothetical protein
MPVTVAARSKALSVLARSDASRSQYPRGLKAWTVFARSDDVIMGLNPTQVMDVWCAYVFILCLCCPVFR